MRKGTASVVLTLVSVFAGAAVGAIGTSRKMSEKIYKASEMSDKHLALFLMMNQWVKVKQEGKDLSSYFERKGYKNIAMYGMSYAGETLINELKNTNIHVDYAIDKNADSIYADVDVVGAEDQLNKVDAVVVTAITFFNEIEEKLADKVGCPVISLEDILYEV